MRLLSEISKLDEEDIFWTAWYRHNDKHGRTEVWYIPETKEVKIITTEKVVLPTPAILLFTIEQNTIVDTHWKWEDILSPDEYKQCEKMISEGRISDRWEFLEKKKIDFRERLGKYILLENNFRVFNWNNIKQQIQELETKGGENEVHRGNV